MRHWNVLTLEPQSPEFVVAAFGDASRKSRSTESRRLDIVIDGRALRYWWRDWEQSDSDEEVPVADLVTMLSSTSRRDAIDQLRQLQGPAIGCRPTRAELYYCAACFDVSNGILTVEIDRTPDAIVWRALGWKDEFQDGSEDALIPNTTEFMFDPVAYDSMLERARAGFRSGWHLR
jgi:hypothetical protein